MRLDRLPSEFQKALPILNKIRKAGFEAYFVGGCVRDALLNRPIHDVDIASSAFPQEIKAIFKRTVDIGIEHGTVLVLEEGGEYEVTTFRTEESYVDYRRPSAVHFVRTLEEDLKRRDFTVNALALDETGQIIDLFHGLEDLADKRLRAVGRPEERFQEDALRILRGLRFSATLDFDIDDRTFLAMVASAPLLEKIAIERSFIELDKLLMAPYWKKGIQALAASGAQDYLPHLTASPNRWSQFVDAFQEDYVFKASAQAWAALIIALDQVPALPFIKKWKTSIAFRQEVTGFYDLYQVRREGLLGPRALYHYGKEAAKWVEDLRQGQNLPVDWQALDGLIQSLRIWNKQDICVGGADLIRDFGLAQGPQVGQLLREIELAIVDGKLSNDSVEIYSYLDKILNK